MKILIIILFSLSLYAQDALIVSRGSGGFEYDIQTDTNQVVNDDLYLYAIPERTQNDTGGVYYLPYGVWKYEGSSYDSLSPSSYLMGYPIFTISDVEQDTTGTWYASLRYKSRNNNWVYARGDDSSFTIGLYGLEFLTAELAGDSAHLSYNANAKTAKVYVLRKINEGSYALFDSTTNLTTYYDSDVDYDSTYYYRVLGRSWKYTYTDTSDAGNVTIRSYPYGGIQFAETPFDFDIQIQDTDTTRTLYVLQTGDDDTVIDSVVNWGDGFTTDATFPDTIAVGDTNSYNITFDISQDGGSYSTQTAWYLTGGGVEYLTVQGEIIIQVPDAITGLAFTDTTETTVSLSCDADGNATGYHFGYKLTAGTTWNISGSLTTTKTISGLSGGTQYSFRVRGYNDGGNGVWSDTITVATLTPATVPDQVTGLDTTYIFTNSAGIIFNDIDEETFYSIWLRDSTEYPYDSIAVNIADDTTYAPLILESGTGYYARVRAGNDAGVGEYSDTLYIRTPTPPQVIPQVSLTYPSGSSDIDDGAIWWHPSDMSNSVVVGSDKGVDRLHVFDLQGNLLYSYSLGWTPGNIDIFYEFGLDGTTYDIFAVNDRDGDRIMFYCIDSSTYALTNCGAIDISGVFGEENYGLGTYRSPYDTTFYVFVTDYEGAIGQWELYDNSGEVAAVGDAIVRGWETGGASVNYIAEGTVCDWETGKVYVGRENYDIRMYAAEPDSSTTYQLAFANVGTNGIEADIEGVAIYYLENGDGYIIFSNQGADNQKIFDRKTKAFVKTITVENSTDGDGLDVANGDFSPFFPYGFLLMHNGTNGLLLNDWSQYGLTVNTTYWNPRIGLTAPVPLSDSLLSFTSFYNFGSHDSSGSSTNYQLTITNNSGITIPNIEFSGLSGQFSTSASTIDSLEDDESTQITITFSHDGDAGIYTDSLIITSDFKTQYLSLQGQISGVTEPGVIRTADYYFDAENGSNSNNGLTPQTAKQNISGYNSLSKAGKTIAFRDSMYYRGRLNVYDDGVTITNWYEDGSDQLPKFTPSVAVTGFSDQGGNIWRASTSSASTVWLIFPQHTFTSDSAFWGLRQSGTGDLNREGEFVFTGGYLYIYAPSDPDSYYESVNKSEGSQYCIEVRGSDVTVQYVESFGVENGWGIFVKEGADNVTVEYSNFHHCGSWDDLGDGGGSGHSIGWRASNGVIRGCKAWEGSNHGIHYYAYSADITNVITEGCQIYNNHHTGADQNATSGDIYNLTFRYNLVYETLYARERSYIGSGSRQVGFWEQSSSISSNNEYYYNICINNKRQAFALNGSNNQVHNNTVIQTVSYTSAISNSCFNFNGTGYNNLAFFNSGSMGVSGSTNIGGSISNAENYIIACEIGMDWDEFNWHLKSGSNGAVNNGTDVGLTQDYDGDPIVGNPDTGVDER